ncbi:MAG TPA: glycoside hydrolase family 3 N-terminal domain-containing protein [Spirochaetales bacterium]|nr:glycoside hydrolase family 3 N-terminal domain-containing protein [Spirochaetales bacterium]
MRRTILLGLGCMLLFSTSLIYGNGKSEIALKGPSNAVSGRKGTVASQSARLLSSLSLEEKCASVLMIPYGGANRFTEEFRERYQRIPAGAVLLFGYNVPPTAREFIDLTRGIREAGATAGKGIPPFIAIDHEGGTVLRLKGITTNLPDARVLGRSSASAEQIRRLYGNTAQQLFLLGITMNLAPVVEPLSEETLSFLSRRAYSEDPQKATLMGGTFLQEMRTAGVLGVAKHFPGSGDADPHERLPKSSAHPSDPEDPLTLPFRSLHKRGLLDALMVGHVRVPSEGIEEPATLSPRILTEILRKQWRYEGLVVTDDIRMKGLSRTEDPSDAVVRALNAGADMVMYLGGDYPTIHKNLVKAVEEGRLSLHRLDEAAGRILQAKIRYGIIPDTSGASHPDRLDRVPEFQRIKAEGDRLLSDLSR